MLPMLQHEQQEQPMLKNVAGKIWGPAAGASPQTDQLLSPPDALGSMDFQGAQSPKSAWSLFLAMASIPKQRLSASAPPKTLFLLETLDTAAGFVFKTSSITSGCSSTGLTS